MEEPKEPLKKKGIIATIAAAVATVTTLVIEHTELLAAVARLLRSIAG